jgi:hypothetical protein
MNGSDGIAGGETWKDSAAEGGGRESKKNGSRGGEHYVALGKPRDRDHLRPEAWGPLNAEFVDHMRTGGRPQIRPCLNRCSPPRRLLRLLRRWHGPLPKRRLLRLAASTLAQPSRLVSTSSISGLFRHRHFDPSYLKSRSILRSLQRRTFHIHGTVPAYRSAYSYPWISLACLNSG